MLAYELKVKAHRPPLLHMILKKDVAQRSGSERIQSEIKHCPNGNTVRSLTITSSFQLLAVGLLVEYCGRNIAVAGRCALARHLPPAPHWSESVLVKHVKCHGLMGWPWMITWYAAAMELISEVSGYRDWNPESVESSACAAVVWSLLWAQHNGILAESSRLSNLVWFSKQCGIILVAFLTLRSTDSAGFVSLHKSNLIPRQCPESSSQSAEIYSWNVPDTFSIPRGTASQSLFAHRALHRWRLVPRHARKALWKFKWR